MQLRTWLKFWAFRKAVLKTPRALTAKMVIARASNDSEKAAHLATQARFEAAVMGERTTHAHTISMIVLSVCIHQVVSHGGLNSALGWVLTGLLFAAGVILLFIHVPALRDATRVLRAVDLLSLADSSEARDILGIEDKTS